MKFSALFLAAIFALVIAGAQGIYSDRSIYGTCQNEASSVTNNFFGSSTFLSLNDTPNSYSGSGDLCVKVNIGETGLVFGDCGNGSSGGNVSNVVGDAPYIIVTGATTKQVSLNETALDDQIESFNYITLAEYFGNATQEFYSIDNPSNFITLVQYYNNATQEFYPLDNPNNYINSSNESNWNGNFSRFLTLINITQYFDNATQEFYSISNPSGFYNLSDFDINDYRTVANNTFSGNVSSTIDFCITGGNCLSSSGGGSGDITGVEAGTGLIGGGSSGDVTINVSADTCGPGEVSTYNGTHFLCETSEGSFDLNISADAGSGVITNGEIFEITGNGTAQVETYFSGNELTIEATDTDTTYSNGTGLNLLSEVFSVRFGTNFLGWTNLTNYPATCNASQYISALGDTITCGAIAITTAQITNFASGVNAIIGNFFDQDLNTTSDVVFETVNTSNLNLEADGNITFGGDARIYVNSTGWLIIQVS